MTTERPTSGKFPEAVARHLTLWAAIREGRIPPPPGLAMRIKARRWLEQQRLEGKR